MLNPNFNHVGCGAILGEDGYYVSVVFVSIFNDSRFDASEYEYTFDPKTNKIVKTCVKK